MKKKKKSTSKKLSSKKSARKKTVTKKAATKKSAIKKVASKKKAVTKKVASKKIAAEKPAESYEQAPVLSAFSVEKTTAFPEESTSSLSSILETNVDTDDTEDFEEE